MKRNRIVAFLLVIAFCSGCGTIQGFNVYNNTGNKIFLTTTHTGETVSIHNKSWKTVDHGAGDFYIQTHEKVFCVKGVIAIYEPAYLKKSLRYGLIPCYKSNIVVTPDFSLYVCNWKGRILQAQPEGFPMRSEQIMVTEVEK